MNGEAVMIVAALVVFVCAVGGALFAGYRAGLDAGKALQAEANAHAIAEAEARRVAAEMRETEGNQAVARQAVKLAELHANVEKDREAFWAQVRTGDIEGAVQVAEERNARLAQDLEALRTDERTDPEMSMPTVLMPLPKGEPS